MSEQESICAKYNSEVVLCDVNKKIGIAMGSMNIQPTRGKRFLPLGDTEGWYIWGGDSLEENDLFQAVHVSHIEELFPDVYKYLALAPGFTFIIDETGYEDVWFDEELSRKFHDE